MKKDDPSQQLSLFDMGFDDAETKLESEGNKSNQSSDVRHLEELESIHEFADIVLSRIEAICESRHKKPLNYGLRKEIEALHRSCNEYTYIRMKLLERIADKMEISLTRLLGDRPRYEEQPKGYIVFEEKLYRIRCLSDLQTFLNFCGDKIKDCHQETDNRPVYIRRIEELCTDRKVLLDRMHISSARFSTILRKTNSITLPMVKRFADALEVPMIELFREPEKEDFLATISCRLKNNVRVVCRTFTRYDKLLEHCHEIEKTIEERTK